MFESTLVPKMEGAEYTVGQKGVAALQSLFE
jgi:hypothetical protein